MPAEYTITAQPSSDVASNITRTAIGSVSRTVYTSTAFADPAFTLGSVTLRASAALANTTSSTASADQYNYLGARGAAIYCNISAAGTSGAGALTVRLQEYDDLAAAYVDSTGATFAATTVISLRTLYLYPGMAETANTEVSRPIPPVWRIQSDASSSAGSFTFSVSARYLL